jgi:hypothetical protein
MAAMLQEIPSGPGERNRKTLSLVRRLKFEPEFAGITPLDLDTIKPLFNRWWKEIEPKISDVHTIEDSWDEFHHAWEQANSRYGETEKQVLEWAKENIPQRAIEKYGTCKKSVLVAICMKLQEVNGGKWFHLSTRKAGGYLGYAGGTRAGVLLKQIQKDGFIQLIAEHERGKRLATEFRYLG